MDIAVEQVPLCCWRRGFCRWGATAKRLASSADDQARVAAGHPRPTTKPATTYVEVLRDHDPKFPATQPLDIPADLKDAGHYQLPEPVYLCPQWRSVDPREQMRCATIDVLEEKRTTNRFTSPASGTSLCAMDDG